MTNIKGAIFDVDGTMLDSMHVWENVAENYLKSQGGVPHPDLNEALSKMGGHQIPAYFREEYGVTGTEEEIHAGINALLEDFYLNEASLKAGVVEVLEMYYNHGIKMCVATATDRSLIEPALQRCGIAKYFGRIFTCPEERTSKSRPDIYITAANFLGTEIGDTLVFEDALYAVKSAKQAGFPVVGVYDTSAEDHQDKIRALVDYYVKSFVDFMFE
ncbi:MAG: HAD family phosphatase [Oscillospiraceae bacterium]|nr:HAD family phosphatase [Oscillospiraceae bacterium]